MIEGKHPPPRAARKARRMTAQESKGVPLYMPDAFYIYWNRRTGLASHSNVTCQRCGLPQKGRPECFRHCSIRKCVSGRHLVPDLPIRLFRGTLVISNEDQAKGKERQTAQESVIVLEERDAEG